MRCCWRTAEGQRSTQLFVATLAMDRYPLSGKGSQRLLDLLVVFIAVGIGLWVYFWMRATAG